MTLFKTSALNAIAVGIRLVSMLILNKILAIHIGPTAYGLVGQLQNVITTVTTVASAGTSTGITKYTAEYTGKSDDQRRIWRTATFSGIAITVLLAIALLSGSNFWSVYFFGGAQYQFVIVFLSAALIFYVLNTILLAILNGLGEIRLFVVANIANSLLALFITGFLAWLWGLEGALIALTINQSIVFFVTLLFVWRRPWFRLVHFFGVPDKESIQRLSHFVLMAAATSVLGPIAQIFIRNVLAVDAGMLATGYWEAMTRISNLYLMVITMPLSVYYLPRMAMLSKVQELKDELIKVFMFLLPVTLVTAAGIFVFRDLIVSLLFTKDFAPMLELFAWQLAGDVIRMVAWLFSYLLLSKAASAKFLIAEVTATFLLVLLSITFIAELGMIGASVAYAVTNVIYLLTLLVMTKTLFSAIDKAK